MDLTLGSTSYQLIVTERSGEFTAHAVRGEQHERFGIETTGASSEEALARLTRWLEWQHEHTQALEVLQQAERAYHRAVADAAFSTSLDGAADAGSKASLAAVDAARNLLDEVRSRRPDV